MARKLFDPRAPSGAPLEEWWVADQFANPCERCYTIRDRLARKERLTALDFWLRKHDNIVIACKTAPSQ